ncbi:MAG: UDP-N-acetylmuramoyl-L-alanyl-D-glutamate--2,6-diaminopimelate ligase [Legionellales bacterium RIFCSPHIGHO2_12_FULL_37_14]|nr:MAG: UDP-N-acetylmuramoyl-L-alanyl-D-glutamate--2,6-diaminopimelate ligase [Legionellales bacterium RIFCSPHIGHO2_12_FULL_37_14]
MKLSFLVKPWCIDIKGDCEVTGLCNDSRQLKKGDVFLAYKGAISDGRQYIDAAMQKGAAAIIYEPQGFKPNIKIPMVAMESIFARLGLIAARFYANPSKKLNIIGVTGTTGKTTVAYLLAQAFNLLGEKAIYLGTLGYGEPFSLTSLVNTTPDGLYLQKIFADCVVKGVKNVCMEVSSHALYEDRVSGVNISTAIFTNLSHEHLDFHKTMQAYKEAKAKLFAEPKLQNVILNADDEVSKFMADRVNSPQAKIITFGIKNSATVSASEISCKPHSVSFVLNATGKVRCNAPLVGLFNVANLLAVASTLFANKISLSSVQSVLTKLKSAPGRFELVAENPTVIVDYAHKPVALENVLKTLKDLYKERIILVFGCGGDRDKLKRPQMGKIASQYADLIILTNDNPRTENAEEIIKQIKAGIKNSATVIEILNRKAAIQKALALANKNDVILIAGKGHETYQEIGHARINFSDQAEVGWALAQQKNLTE